MPATRVARGLASVTILAMATDMTHVKQLLLEGLGGKEPGRLDSPQARRAAVLMPLWDDGAAAQVVFTKRNANLPTHAGQISFPGGAVEEQDPDLSGTALRETCEEIGVCHGAVEVVARLDQVTTITNYLVTPFVGLVSPQADFRLNPEEVERLVVVPLSVVLDRSRWRETEIPYQGMRLKQTALAFNGDVVWGATARILLGLIERLGPQAAVVAGAAGAK